MREKEWPILLGDLGKETKSVDLLEQVVPLGERKEKGLPEEIPILPLEDNVLFPEITVLWVVHGENWVRLVHEMVLRDKIVGVLALQKKLTSKSIGPEGPYEIGVVEKISRMLRPPEETVQVLIFGLAPFIVKEWIRWESSSIARVEVVRVEEVRTDEVEALKCNILNLFQRVVELAPYLPKEAFVAAMNIKGASRLAHFVAFNLNLEPEAKQEILVSFDLVEKLRRATYYLTRELEILRIGSEIQAQIQREMARTQREYFLRGQLKAIQRELGELDEHGSEVPKLRERIKSLRLAPEIEKKIEKEPDWLFYIPTTSPEYSVIRNYIDWVLELPWNRSTEDVLDVELAREILDEDHHDLEKVKERILEHLTVCQLKKDLRGPILCFVGPPGVGKTSLGRSIVRSLGRRFVRISLGGARDEVEIRGHRRTHIEAMPGRIIQGIRRAGTDNPIFMLDEVDKIGADFRGDPASALLEVLIARQYLIPKQCKENGISEEIVRIPEKSVLAIVREYTRGAGFRQLGRSIAAVCRKMARKVASGDFVDTVILPGKGNPVLTGNMGKIMQESARIVLSCVREWAREWNIAEDFYEKSDVHIHVPAGAIPKSGPSAGVTVAVSLVSALTRTPLRQGLAMTGEITLVGRILPVGGVKEKILAAHRAGVKEVLLPRENEKDLEEITLGSLFCGEY